MSKLYFNLLNLFVAICLMSLTGCSDSDEQKEETYQFNSLEEILGSTTWTTKSYSFVASDGTTVSPHDIQIGGLSTPTIALENGSLIQYNVEGPVVKYIYDYRFNRATGDIYVRQGYESEMRIVSVEPDKILVQSNFGILEREHDTDGQPTEIEGGTSYMLSELVPADEALMESIANPHEVINLRK